MLAGRCDDRANSMWLRRYTAYEPRHRFAVFVLTVGDHAGTDGHPICGGLSLASEPTRWAWTDGGIDSPFNAAYYVGRDISRVPGDPWTAFPHAEAFAAR